jgi:hypothetical protein
LSFLGEIFALLRLFYVNFFETSSKLIKGKALTRKGEREEQKERTNPQHPSLQKHKLRFKKETT